MTNREERKIARDSMARWPGTKLWPGVKTVTLPFLSPSPGNYLCFLGFCLVLFCFNLCDWSVFQRLSRHCALQ